MKLARVFATPHVREVQLLCQLWEYVTQYIVRTRDFRLVAADIGKSIPRNASLSGDKRRSFRDST